MPNYHSSPPSIDETAHGFTDHDVTRLHGDIVAGCARFWAKRPGGDPEPTWRQKAGRMSNVERQHRKEIES